MILATVGTQLPFPRLLNALDAIATRHDLDVVAQTCVDLADARTIKQRPFVAPAEFDALASAARLIVGHAGIGTIIGADRASRPLILYPRKASLGEHRNDHQIATAKAMAARAGIYVAWDDAELEELITSTALIPLRRGESPTRAALVAELARFVNAAGAA